MPDGFFADAPHADAPEEGSTFFDDAPEPAGASDAAADDRFDAEDEEGPADPPAPPDEDPSPDDDPDERESLKAALEAAQQRLREIETQQAQQRAHDYWESERNRGASWYAQAEADLRRQAAQTLDPNGFLAEQLPRLYAGRDAWFQDYYAKREESLHSARAMDRLPQFVDHLLHKYALPPQDAAKLMEFAPDDMEKVAVFIADARKVKKQIRQQEVAARNPGPGAGSSRVGPRKAPRNLDEFVDRIFAEPE